MRLFDLAALPHPGGGRPALSNFRPGDAVIVIGKIMKPGKPLVARVIAAQ